MRRLVKIEVKMGVIFLRLFGKKLFALLPHRAVPACEFGAVEVQRLVGFALSVE